MKKKTRRKRKPHQLIASAAVVDGLYIVITEHTERISIMRGSKMYILTLPSLTSL